MYPRQKKSWLHNGPLSLTFEHATRSSNKGRNETWPSTQSSIATWLPDDTEVFVTTGGQPSTGRIIQPASNSRSYLVKTPSGSVRRNCSQLNVVPDAHSNTLDPADSTVQSRSPIRTPSRTGTHIAPPERLAWDREIWHKLRNITISVYVIITYNDSIYSALRYSQAPLFYCVLSYFMCCTCCIASWFNWVHNNTTTGCTKLSKIKCIAVCLLELCTDLTRFVKTVHVVRLVGRAQSSTRSSGLVLHVINEAKNASFSSLLHQMLV